MESIGMLNLAIQIGADGPDRVGIIVEVKKGRDFMFWKDLGIKPGFGEKEKEIDAFEINLFDCTD